MGQLGVVAMLNQLFDDNKSSIDAVRSALGKRIAEVSLGQDDALHFVMEDGFKFKIFDDGQSCCEHRYMTTDDDIQSYVGSTFKGAEIKSAPSIVEEDSYEEHDVEFLEIQTDRGVFTMANHNEHNGYYGGFSVNAQAE